MLISAARRGGEGPITETLGERVRAMRAEHNLSQKGLASRLPGPPHLSWVSKVEKNQIDLKLSDLYALASALKVTPGWLVAGDSEETEFIARLRGMQGYLDERAKRSILALAQHEVERTREALEEGSRAAAIQRLLSDPEVQARYEELLRAPLESPAGPGEAHRPGEAQPRRRRGQGR